MTPSLASPNQFEILFHETMAAVLRAQESTKRQFGLIGNLNAFWKSSRDLKAFRQTLVMGFELPDGTISNEWIAAQIPKFHELLAAIEELLDAARRGGFMNRTLSNVPLRAITDHAKYLDEYVDTLEMSIDPEVIKAIDEGRAQIERGEYETMDRLY